MNAKQAKHLSMALVLLHACSPVFGAGDAAIKVKERVLFDGLAGWEHEGVTYRLACGAILSEAPNGDLLCCWLSGSNKEPATDNCVLLARSTDKGKTWEEPSILVPAGDMAGAVTSMYSTSDGRMILFGAHWPSEKHYTVWYYFRRESRDNGHTWSEPEPISIHDDHISFCGPVKLENGEFLFPASFFDKREKPLVGPIAKIAHAKSEAEALAIPKEEGQKHMSKFATHLHGCSVLISKDEDARELVEYGHIGNRPGGLLEPTCIQLASGKIVMFIRAEYGGFLWRAESSDNGRTWTDAWQTDIPHPTSLTNLVRLADGRIALIHNANGGIVGERSARDPLSIWISDDELESWSIQQDVIHGGSLAYPNGRLLEDRLVFVYDHNRRQVRYVEVDIPPVVRDRR